MREIKFRGKPVYSGGKAVSWVYGTFKYIPCNVISPGATDNGRRELRHDKGIITEPYYGSDFEVLCETVGQYTGLKDRNGKEIYEGDIVQCGDFVYKVVYEGKRFASFGLRRPEDMFMHYFGEAMEASRCTVIGNIYDNPELINAEL